MHKALVIKELRESAGLVALAVLGSAYALADLTGVRLLPWQWRESQIHVPFLDDDFLLYPVLVGGLLAVALGLKQSAWELWQGTYPFLLQRPASRRLVFGTKLVVGGGLLLVVTGGLILLYALWAARPGHHASPFFWSMTVPAWQMWFSLPGLYLGAFLSGIRPGRWFGTRLAPLAAGAVLLPVAAPAPWWWLGLVIALVADAVFVASILTYVQVRDY
jgi:hypothetical protein